MSWTTYHNKPDAYLDEAFEVTGKRIAASEWLMDNTEWDLMASVWVSIDRTQHCLSNYIAPDHPDYAKNKDTRIGKKVADIFRQTDDAIGRVRLPSASRRHHPVHLRPRLPVVHPRDPHGPHAARDLASWSSAPPTWCSARCSGAPCARSRARSTTPWACTGRSRCRSRSTGPRRRRTPRSAPPVRASASTSPAARSTASSTPATTRRCAATLMDRLANYVDPKTGKKPVKEIAKREEVFKGKFADQAPDIMMVPNEGYSLTHAKSSIEDADWVSGDHRMEGIIVAAGPNVTPFEQTAGADRHGADLRRRPRCPHGREAHRPRPARDPRDQGPGRREATEESSAAPASPAWATRPPSPTPKPTRWKSTSGASATSSSADQAPLAASDAVSPSSSKISGREAKFVDDGGGRS